MFKEFSYKRKDDQKHGSKHDENIDKHTLTSSVELSFPAIEKALQPWEFQRVRLCFVEQITINNISVAQCG
jgi:hypothetical protein